MVDDTVPAFISGQARWTWSTRKPWAQGTASTSLLVNFDLMAGVGCAMCCDIFCSPFLLIQGFKGHRGEPGASGPKASVKRCLLHVFVQINLHWTSTTAWFLKRKLLQLIHLAQIFCFFCETVQFRPCKYEPNCLRDQKTELQKFSAKCQVAVMGDSCFMTESSICMWNNFTYRWNHWLYKLISHMTINIRLQYKFRRELSWRISVREFKYVFIFILNCSSRKQELEQPQEILLPRSVSSTLYMHLLREKCCTCCFVSHAGERFSATWPMAWLITDSSDWATMRPRASQSCCLHCCTDDRQLIGGNVECFHRHADNYPPSLIINKWQKY